MLKQDSVLIEKFRNNELQGPELDKFYQRRNELIKRARVLDLSVWYPEEKIPDAEIAIENETH